MACQYYARREKWRWGVSLMHRRGVRSCCPCPVGLIRFASNGPASRMRRNWCSHCALRVAIRFRRVRAEPPVLRRRCDGCCTCSLRRLRSRRQHRQHWKHRHHWKHRQQRTRHEWTRGWERPSAGRASG